MRLHCSPTITISRSLNVAKWKEPQDSAFAGADGYALMEGRASPWYGQVFAWYGG